MKKVLKCLTFMFAILLLAGCGKEIELKDGENVLVSFEKEELNISVKDLYDRLKDDFGTSYLVEMIDEKILDLEYETDDVANAYLETQIEAFEVNYGGSDKFLEALQSSGYETIDEFKEYLLLNYKRNLAVEDYIKESISDKEIEKYYDEKVIGDITASHILVKIDTNSTMTDAEKRNAEDEAKKTVDEIYKKLEEGTDFHELAKEYSDDTSNASNGGRLGSFGYGEMENAFEKAAKELEVGKYNTTAVQTSYGFHIILKESEKEKPELKTVKQTIIEELAKEKLANDSKLQYEALVELRKSYGIEITDEDLNTGYDNAVNNWLYGEDE